MSSRQKYLLAGELLVNHEVWSDSEKIFRYQLILLEIEKAGQKGLFGRAVKGVQIMKDAKGESNLKKIGSTSVRDMTVG